MDLQHQTIRDPLDNADAVGLSLGFKVKETEICPRVVEQLPVTLSVLGLRIGKIGRI